MERRTTHSAPAVSQSPAQAHLHRRGSHPAPVTGACSPPIPGSRPVHRQPVISRPATAPSVSGTRSSTLVLPSQAPRQPPLPSPKIGSQPAARRMSSVAMQPPPTPPVEFHLLPQSSASIRRSSQSSSHTTATLQSMSPRPSPSSVQASSYSHPARPSPRYSTQPGTQSGSHPGPAAAPVMRSPMILSSATAVASSPLGSQLHFPCTTPLPQSPIDTGFGPFVRSQLVPMSSPVWDTQYPGTGIGASPQLSQPTPQLSSVLIPGRTQSWSTGAQQSLEGMQAAEMGQMGQMMLSQSQSQQAFAQMQGVEMGGQMGQMMPSQSQPQMQSPSTHFTYPVESMAAAVAIAGAHNLRPMMQLPGMAGLSGTSPVSRTGRGGSGFRGQPRPQQQGRMRRGRRQAGQGRE
ncbi:hypothetical protein BT67DRAFT_270686 [Trichocladium antarcticum]|uniref:Uncharacterized protein n=1 Tax=Trichocladium antarcticum TaxID=1450529 RepID=A0AAN6ZEU6_9PEZI|nr:hypothetical protein BT67DRAFT_270686 [Trichocladium antarcticum]